MGIDIDSSEEDRIDLQTDLDRQSEEGRTELGFAMDVFRDDDEAARTHFKRKARLSTGRTAQRSVVLSVARRRTCESLGVQNRRHRGRSPKLLKGLFAYRDMPAGFMLSFPSLSYQRSRNNASSSGYGKMWLIHLTEDYPPVVADNAPESAVGRD